MQGKTAVDSGAASGLGKAVAERLIEQGANVALFDLNEGLSWRKAVKTKTLKNIQFWKGKRAQVGKKIPKGFNKNLKFNS